MDTRYGAPSEAVALLAAGEAVAVPTETVYGLAADATRPDAVLKIFEAKERPFFDPLITHLPDIGWLDRVTRDRDPLVARLTEKFWPGPLTLVLPRREIIPDVVTSGLGTVAVRMSSNPVFREILLGFGKPLAAPSANRFGRISPTTAQHVMSELGGRIPLIVDGGPTSFGVESTIVLIENARINILRSGPVTVEDLAEFGEAVLEKGQGAPNAPGQLQSHYAPRTRLVLRTPGLRMRFCQTDRIGYLAWSHAPLWREPRLSAVEILSPTGNLREAAATLFAKMRRLDDAGLDLIIAEKVPETGLGVAIMDRLRKAAAKGMTNDETPRE